MILITTPTGNTGRHALATVLASGRPVRVLARDPSRLASGDRGRCDVVEGALLDQGDLARALQGVGTAFVCVPQSADPEDLDAYYRGFAGPFAKAAGEAAVGRLVTVSGGDEGPDLSGPGRALQTMEAILSGSGAAARHLRCGYFMENLLFQASALAYGGAFHLPLAPDVPLAFVAARDIGGAAGRLMLDQAWSGVAGVEAFGPAKIPCAEAAEILSEALGRPIRYVRVPGDEWAEQLVGYGLSRAMATSLRDMFAAIEAGRDMGGRPHSPVECPTTLAAWAKSDLAPAVAAAMGGTGGGR